MATLANLVVKITANADQMIATLNKSETRVSGFDSKLRAMRGPLLALGGALTGLGLVSVKTASDLEQSIGAVESVFGQSADQVLAFGETASKSLAVSQRAFNEAVTPLGAMLTNAGLSADQAASSVIDLAKVGGDLAATYGGSVRDAMDALAAAFRGEADPAERFGLSLKISNVNARALALGLADTTSEITAQGRAQALMSLIAEQTSSVQGQLGRESGTVAVQMQKAQASMEDISAELGKNLIPYVEKLLGWLNDLFDWFSDLPEPVKEFTVILGAVAAGFVLVALVIPPVITLMTALGVTTNIALAGIPLLIAGIIAGIAFLILKWDEVVEFMKGVGGWILLAFGPIGLAAKLVIDNWELVKESVRKVFNFFVDAVNGILDGLDAVIDAMNLVAGVFGEKIPPIEFRLSHWEQSVRGVQDAYEDLAEGAGGSFRQMLLDHTALAGGLVALEEGLTHMVAKHEEARARIRNEGVSSTVASINQVLEGLNLNGISGLAGTSLSNQLGEGTFRGHGISQDYQREYAQRVLAMSGLAVTDPAYWRLKESLESAPQRLADAIDPGTFSDSVLPTLPGQFAGQSAGPYDQSDATLARLQGITVNVYVDGREAQQSSASVHMEEDPYR